MTCCSVSDTSSRTRFCTDAELPSENSFSSSLAKWPFSSPKTSSTFSSRRSATLRARSVNCSSTWREARSNSVFTNSALAAPLAIQHAGADLHGVDDGAGRVLPRLGPLAHDARGGLVLHHEVVDAQAVARRR